MAKFHFVQDYERLVSELIASHDIDTAMELAIGGSFEITGKIQADILLEHGLLDGMKFLDVGCGSGRTAIALQKRVDIDYVGVDIIQDLLDYASDRCPDHYEFVMNRGINLPFASNRFDLACAFSLFTHLLHEESYLYVRDIHRCLKEKGVLILSFLEFKEPGHWHVFENNIRTRESDIDKHLDMFIHRDMLNLFATKIGFHQPLFIDAGERVSNSGALGQSMAILKKV